jgi:hypothetical protein
MNTMIATGPTGVNAPGTSPGSGLKVYDPNNNNNNNNNNPNSVVVVSSEQQQEQQNASGVPNSLDALLEIGMAPDVAEGLCQAFDGELILAWIEHARSHAKTSVPGFVRRALEKGWSLPVKPPSRPVQAAPIPNVPPVQADAERRVEASQRGQTAAFLKGLSEAERAALQAEAEALVHQGDPKLRRLEVAGMVEDLTRRRLGLPF